MSDLRDELAEVIDWHIGGEHPFDPHDWRCYDKSRYPGECGCRGALVDDLLPIITRETTRARAEVGSLIRAHRDAETAYWAMADDADAETAKRLAAEVTRTYEALLASVEGES